MTSNEDDTVAYCARQSIALANNAVRIVITGRATAGITSSSAIAERPCCRGVSYDQKWKTGTERQYFADIIDLPSTTVTELASKAIEFGEKVQNKVYTAVHGHSRSSRLVSIESPYATSYWSLPVVVTDILSRTVSELSQLIVQVTSLLGHESK